MGFAVLSVILFPYSRLPHLSQAWYVSVAIQPKWSASWMVQLKKVLVLALGQLQGLQVCSVDSTSASCPASRFILSLFVCLYVCGVVWPASFRCTDQTLLRIGMYYICI